MPRVKPCDRKRAKRPKTRTGCSTCRLRRIKCDEEKPNCYRCSSTGRKCDWDALSLVSKAGDDFAIVRLDSVSSLFESTKERRAFCFFQERTSAQLSGFFTCDFWECIILQAAHTNPGIRHAIVALASLHEDFEASGEAEGSVDGFALKQYNSAIRQHLTDLESGEMDNNPANIASCLVFICIEIIQRHYASALSLMKSALQLFQRTDFRSLALSPWPIETLEFILNRLQVQALQFGAALHIGGIVLPRVRTLASSNMPEKFTSLLEAKEHIELFYITYRLAQAFDTEDSLDLGEGDTEFFVHTFQKWSTAFDDLVADLGDDINDRDKLSVTFLKMIQLMLGNAVQQAMSRRDEDDSTFFDQYMPRYEIIIDLAETVASLQEKTGKAASTAFGNFTMDVDVIGTLHDTAFQCRDPVLRRRAIQILRTRARREGFYDSLLAARSVECVMELEEGAVGGEVKTAADIPAWARFTRLLPSFHLGERNGLTVDYCGQRLLGEDGEIVSCREIIA